MPHDVKRYFEFGPSQHNAFDDLVKKTKVAIMVIIVQPHCPHCDALKPHLLKLKHSLEPDEDKAKVVILDSAATEASKSKSVKGVTGVPTIRGVLKGKHIREHRGSRDSTALQQFLSSLDEESEQESQNNSQEGGRRRRRRPRHRRRTHRRTRRRKIKKHTTKRRKSKKRKHTKRH